MMTLPEGTEPSQIDAEFDDGLVEITVHDAVAGDESTRISLTDRSEGATRRRVSGGS